MPCIRCYTAGEEGVRVGGHGTNRGKWEEGTLHSHNIPYLTAQLNNNHNWLLRWSFVQSCLQWRRLLNLKATHHLSSSYLVRTNCSCFAYSSSRRRLWLLGCSWTDEEELHFYWWTFIVMAVNLLPENSKGQESGLDWAMCNYYQQWVLCRCMSDLSFKEHGKGRDSWDWPCPKCSRPWAQPGKGYGRMM